MRRRLLSLSGVKNNLLHPQRAWRLRHFKKQYAQDAADDGRGRRRGSILAPESIPDKDWWRLMNKGMLQSKYVAAPHGDVREITNMLTEMDPNRYFPLRQMQRSKAKVDKARRRTKRREREAAFEAQRRPWMKMKVEVPSAPMMEAPSAPVMEARSTRPLDRTSLGSPPVLPWTVFAYAPTNASRSSAPGDRRACRQAEQTEPIGTEHGDGRA